jgi:hypothetical protein
LAQFVWRYQGKTYTSHVESRCPFCEALAIVRLPARIAQADGTTHVCHPLMGGCNHGFARGVLDEEDLEKGT